MWILATALCLSAEKRGFSQQCAMQLVGMPFVLSLDIYLFLSYFGLEVQWIFWGSPFVLKHHHLPSDVHRQTNTLHLFPNLPEQTMDSFSFPVSLFLCMLCYQPKYFSVITDYLEFISQGFSHLHVGIIFYLNSPAEMIFRHNFYSGCRYMIVWCHTLPL